MLDYSNPQTNTDLAYDLRQIYAKIVGEHLLDIAKFRKSNDYYYWYKSLEDLHTIIKHKFKNQKKDEEDYESIKKKIADLSNKNILAWSGQSNNPKERGDIEELLRRLEEFLYCKMSDAKMFGEGGRIAGL